MKTIAVTIDEPTLERIERLMVDEHAPFKSRSEVVRQAVQEFVARVERLIEEERERKIFRQHRKQLSRQSVALVKEQAKL